MLLSSYTVTSLADDGSAGTLRWATQQASTPGNLGTSSSPNLITFASGLSGTITLTQGVLELSAGDTTIQAPGASVLTVSGNSASGVFKVDAGVTAAINGLTITDGNAVTGGGIDNAGTLTLTNSTVSGSGSGVIAMGAR